MGRRCEAATAVCGGESSPSSTETSFRVLDDVLLQTKTKIWLSQVMKRRLEDDVHISDLLADGELLFDVSKLLWDMLLVKFADIRKAKAPLTKRSSGRYMPYSNVDSFLKVCKVLGLDGIDLFSPSDVVEKRDIRKVCICIRALSKKARSRQLNVPDFDGVSLPTAMPKNMVGYIRKSLETSQCSTSSYSSQSSCQVNTSKPQKKRWNLECDENSDSDSDKSDEAESKYPQNLALSDSILGPDESITTLFDEEEETMWAFLNSIDCDQSDSNQITFKNSYNGKRLDDMDEVSSTMSMNSIVGRVLNIDFDDSFDIGECSAITGRSTEHLQCENDFHDTISLGDNQHQDFPYSSTLSNCSDVEAKESQSEMELEHEGFLLEFLSTYRNQELNGDEETEHLTIEKEMEAQIPENPASELQPPDCIQLKNGDIATSPPHHELLVESVIECTEHLTIEKEMEAQVPENPASELQPPDCIQLTNGDIVTSPPHHELLVESVIECTDISVDEGQSSPDLKEVIQDTAREKHGSMSSNLDEDVSSLANECDCVLGEPPISLAEASGDTIEALGVACGAGPSDVTIQKIQEKKETDGRNHEHPETLAENVITDGMKDQINEPQEAKPQKRRVLKKVAGGTVLIGVLCFLLHISLRGQEKPKEVVKQSRGTAVVAKQSGGTIGKPSSKEEVNVRGNNTYPAAKLKF